MIQSLPSFHNIQRTRMEGTRLLCLCLSTERRNEAEDEIKLTRHTMATAWFEDSSLAAMESPNRSQRSTHVIITYSDKQQDEAQALGPSLQQHIYVCNSELAI
jgi:hypothetical protein